MVVRGGGMVRGDGGLWLVPWYHATPLITVRSSGTCTAGLRRRPGQPAYQLFHTYHKPVP
jgi:hypothetical protein